jgi:hypothetical protein
VARPGGDLAVGARRAARARRRGLRAGHGPPCGRAEIEQLAAYWRWLREGVAEQRAAGRSPGEAARELLRSPEHARFAGWLNPERILVNVATMQRASGELSPPARARLLVQMWALGAELAAAG